MDAPQVTSTDWTIYTGPWVNWSDGLFIGASLTTTTNQGLFLVSFLAIWVALVGGSVWRIICYFLHQVRGRSNLATDGLFHQEQVVLRNSDSAGATFLQLLRMGWAWRGRVNYSIWRVLPLAFIAAVQVVVFIAAGILSSEIFSTDQQVLVRSNHCGRMTYPGARKIGHFSTHEFNQENAAWMESRTVAQFALTYSRSCYGKNPLPNCENLFAVSTLPSVATNTDCPFDPEICLLQHDAGVRMDSGYINTRTLGINSKADQSVDYRRVMTCAPLKTEEYKAPIFQGEKWRDNFRGGPYMGYSYGPNIALEVNETFIIDTYLANYSAPYQPITLAWAFAGVTPSTLDLFIPNSKLNRTDGDVTLVGVTNNVAFSSPTTDAWYKADKETSDPADFATHIFKADPQSSPLIVMGCVEQHQICDPTKPRDGGCSPLTGMIPLGLDTIQLSPTQKALKELVRITSATNLLQFMILNLGSSALLASQFLQSSISPDSQPLPENFWREEVKSWQALNMARLQKSMVNIAQGPANPVNQKYVQTLPKSITDHFDVCDSIKIRDGRFYSFKIAGLLITVLGGLFLLILDLCLPWLVGKLQLLTHKGVHRKEDWELDQLLQVQRMAYEGSKLGTWVRNETGVPVTLRALGMQRFGKPGRGVGVYEALEMDHKAWHSPSEEDAEFMRPFHARNGSGTPSFKQSQSSFKSGTPSFVSTEYGGGGRPMDEAYWSPDSFNRKKGPTTSVREFI